MIGQKPLNQMSMTEIALVQLRNRRLMSLYLNHPITYKSNVEISDNNRPIYLTISDIASRLRTLVCDDIRIDQIPDVMPITNRKFTVQEIFDIIKPLIKNYDDFGKMGLK